MEKNKKRRGRGFRLIGLLFILAALGLTVYNKLDSDRAGKESNEALEQLIEQMEDEGITMKAAPEFQVSHTPTEFNETDDAESTVEMPEMEVDGNGYIGYISIPDLGIELPVLSTWSMALLKIAPCRYYGSYYTDDLVIAAHNYARHFSPIKWIDMGTEVIFTTVTGEIYRYVVDNAENIQPSEVERMTTGDWDLTLFTCNTGGGSRRAVRCIRAEQ